MGITPRPLGDRAGADRCPLQAGAGRARHGDLGSPRALLEDPAAPTLGGMSIPTGWEIVPSSNGACQRRPTPHNGQDCRNVGPSRSPWVSQGHEAAKGPGAADAPAPTQREVVCNWPPFAPRSEPCAPSLPIAPRGEDRVAEHAPAVSAPARRGPPARRSSRRPRRSPQRAARDRVRSARGTVRPQRRQGER